MRSQLGKNQRAVLQRMILHHDGRWPNNWMKSHERRAMQRLEARGLVARVGDYYQVVDTFNESLRDELGIEL